MTGMRDDRPRLHFTARRGWVNDPHGVTFAGGRYHLFFQHQPERTTWSSGIRWGHATSSDLLHWTEHGSALEPEPGEDGCWTGCLVDGPAGPVILYTSPPAEEPRELARVRAAHGDAALATWRRDGAAPVEAPAGAGVVTFRDPSALQDGAGWAMVVGASMATPRGPEGALLRYRSPDLRRWAYDGVVADAASLAADTGGGVPAREELGTMWECPHLFELDGSWVLLFSVWDGGLLRHVAAAVGELEPPAAGGRFRARARHRFTHGDALYATTTFADAAGRPCALSWLRDDPDLPPDGRGRAGALSLPHLLGLDGDRLTADVHPDVVAAGTPVPWHAGGVTLPAPQALVAVPLAPGGTATVTLGAGLHVVAERDRLLVRDVAAGRDVAQAPRRVPAPAGELQVVVDGGIVEVLAPGVAGPLAAHCRIPGGAPLAVGVTCADACRPRLSTLR
jgi:beta-fructofuranosidase